MHPALIRPTSQKAIQPHVWIDGVQYFSLPEIERRRNFKSRQAAHQWAKRRPGLCTKVGKHTYVREPST